MSQTADRLQVEAPVIGEGFAFEYLYRSEYPRIVALVYALCANRWAAEEIAQDAFAQAHRNWDRVGGYDKPGAWVRRVAINLTNSHIRRRFVEARALAALVTGQRIALPQVPEEDRDFWAGVQSLPRRQREAVVLHYLEGYQVKEIATILEIDQSTVKTHLQRGREALAREIQPNKEIR